MWGSLETGVDSIPNGEVAVNRDATEPRRQVLGFYDYECNNTFIFLRRLGSVSPYAGLSPLIWGQDGLVCALGGVWCW